MLSKSVILDPKESSFNTMKFTVCRLCFRIELVDCKMFISLSKYSSFSKLRSKRQITYGAKVGKYLLSTWFLQSRSNISKFPIIWKAARLQGQICYSCKDRKKNIQTHLTTRGVGIGSNEQDVVLGFAIKCMTSSSLSVLKESKRAEQVLGCCGVRVESVAASSSLVRIRSIFCMKNFPISIC